MDSDEKTVSIHETLKGAKEKVAKDTEAFTVELQEYRMKWNSEYEENKKQIESLKQRSKNNISVTYKDQVEELEIKNETIKKEINSVHIKGNLEWKNFKKNTSQEMEDLKESINRFSDEKI